MCNNKQKFHFFICGFSICIDHFMKHKAKCYFFLITNRSQNKQRAKKIFAFASFKFIICNSNSMFYLLKVHDFSGINVAISMHHSK